jgi:hypothetical protein
MSITFTSRYDVVVNMSRVHTSSRSRVARPRRPGTLPSPARSSGSCSGVTSAIAMSLPTT